MATIIRKENEELFFPKGFWFAYMYIVAGVLFIMGMFFVFLFVDELINDNYGTDYFIKFALLLFFFFFTPIIDIFKLKKIYANYCDRYFRIKNEIIPFEDIVYIKYNYGYLKPFKYSIFSIIFYFVLKDGKEIRIYTFFRGSDVALKQEFADINFSVQKSGFKDL